jgi:hypothetical protein
MLYILKYIFVSYFVVILYAAIMGRQALASYPLYYSSLIDEYLIIMLLFIIIDLLKYLIKSHKVS